MQVGISRNFFGQVGVACERLMRARTGCANTKSRREDLVLVLFSSEILQTRRILPWGELENDLLGGITRRPAHPESPVATYLHRARRDRGPGAP